MYDLIPGYVESLWPLDVFDDRMLREHLAPRIFSPFGLLRCVVFFNFYFLIIGRGGGELLFRI
jgi:hypothetical protein